jgi:hypothetical protein
MLNTYDMTPEVGELMSVCDRIFRRVVIMGRLTALDREILEYYSTELRKHLERSGKSHNVTDTAVSSKDLVPPLDSQYMHNFDCM